MATNTTQWFEYPGNFSGGTSVDGIGTYFQYVNYVVGDNFGAIIMVMVFFISFLMLKAFGSEKGFTASMFITFLIGVLLLRIELIDVVWVIFTGLGAVIGALVLRDSNNRGL